MGGTGLEPVTLQLVETEERSHGCTPTAACIAAARQDSERSPRWLRRSASAGDRLAAQTMMAELNAIQK